MHKITDFFKLNKKKITNACLGICTPQCWTGDDDHGHIMIYTSTWKASSFVIPPHHFRLSEKKPSYRGETYFDTSLTTSEKNQRDIQEGINQVAAIETIRYRKRIPQQPNLLDKQTSMCLFILFLFTLFSKNSYVNQYYRLSMGCSLN